VTDYVNFEDAVISDYEHDSAVLTDWNFISVMLLNNTATSTSQVPKFNKY